MSGYIGTQPVPQATQTRQTFVATAAQTSFATGGYQAGYLDVFLNGVKLQDNVDYTATNGSDIVLTVGAALADTLEVVAYTAFEVLDQTFTGTTTTEGLTVTGAFTSKGIDDNATSTAMTLDSSGNVLVGKTASSFSTAGTQLISGAGGSSITSSGTTALGLNRLASDGDVLTFWKDTSQVGSIGALASRLTIGTDDTGLIFQSAFDNIQPVTMTGNTGRDASISLGASDNRFKDLYLSGGVYLGGTGAANKLDDYEIGLHSPTVTADTGTITLLTTKDNLRYAKIGSLVHIWGRLDVFSVSSPTGKIEVTLPFAVEDALEESNSGAVTCYINGSASLTVGDFAGLVVEGTSYLRLYISTGSSLSSAAANAQQITAASAIWLNLTYTTA